MMLGLSLLLSALVSFASAPALAQSGPAEVLVPEVGVLTTTQVEERIPELERDYQAVTLAGPRAGVGVTAILVAGGAMMAGAGAAANRICIFTDQTVCRSPGGTALAATGTLFLIGGLVGVILTSRKLKQKKEERRRIKLAIERLERALSERDR